MPSSARPSNFALATRSNSPRPVVQPSSAGQCDRSPRSRCCAGCRHIRVRDCRGRRSVSWHRSLRSSSHRTTALTPTSSLAFGGGSFFLGGLRPMTSGSAVSPSAAAVGRFLDDFLHRRHDQILVLQHSHARRQLQVLDVQDGVQPMSETLWRITSGMSVTRHSISSSLMIC